MRRVWPVLLLTGCLVGSQWELTDYVPPPPCTEKGERAWWTDSDGDGWGDPGAPMWECAGREDVDMVRNDLDCDPEDSHVTGLIGAICPADLVLNDSPAQVAGVAGGGAEFVAVHGDTPLEHAIPAEAACRWWGLVGHLATFESDTEWGQMRDALDDVVGDGPYAAWVGVASDGRDWGWSDDSDPSVIHTIGWCEGVEPDPSWYDRAAIIRTPDRPGWCLGMPDLALGEYSRYDAHFVCERPTPEPDAYRYFPEQAP